MFTFSRQAPASIQGISKAAEVFQMTLLLLKDKASRRQKRSLFFFFFPELLSAEDVKLLANLSGCPPALQPAGCPTGGDSEKYRSISGVCNNRNNPLWGAASTVLARWLPAEYEDGESQPKGWNTGHKYSGFQLPPVREVSNSIMQSSSQVTLKDEAYSQLLVDWGQYIDHDISFTPQSSSKSAFLEGLDCLHMCENSNPCFPIQIPLRDKLFGRKSCLPFFRSSPACLNAPTHTLQAQQMLQRQQMNSATSFLDASTVYGHSAELEKALRNLSSPEGLLAVNSKHTDHGGHSYLPFVKSTPSACLQQPGTGPSERVECFLAGDSRVNEILPLTALHTLWVREHNRIATRLKQLNVHWSSLTTYQETRKIIGALHQIITMRDYIPKILGDEAFEETVGSYEGYDESLNPSVSNVFATAAFRFGHATISAQIRRLNESFQEHPNFSSLNLHQTFFSPWRIIREGGLDPILRGLLGWPAARQNQQHLMTEELTEKLVVLNIPESLDLAALNLQRGRDHGLPGYNDWRAFCGYDRVESKADLRAVVRDRALVEQLMDLYGHPNNIDVWLAGLVEDPLPGARIGPIFACLIGKQMKTLREGDRFWWEKSGVFSPLQRQELQKHSLSRVFCDNSGLTEVPLDPFTVGMYPKDFVSCASVPSLDLEAWKEDTERGRTFPKSLLSPNDSCLECFGIALCNQGLLFVQLLLLLLLLSVVFN
ncbi:thyroid peroxidase [Astyanax mexicanus]|uniref:Thyroid peroxidase n=1 Tax=Astyanax mexicanus TaxID=7994 RepID=A0A8T2LAL5_ASTMX|nr:thyroid peroxidase [Astyanax mexicanus]